MEIKQLQTEDVGIMYVFRYISSGALSGRPVNIFGLD